jgi:glutamate transport system substrate-binding protein
VRRRGFLGLAFALGAAGLTEGCVTVSPLATTGAFPVDSTFNLAQSETWLRMKERQGNAGQIIIGVKADQPGLGYYDASTDTYNGFDILIARMVAAGLGFQASQIQFTTVASEDRESELENKTLDLIVASYSYTPERAKLVGFAGPYLLTPEAIMVARNNTSITGLDSITPGTTACEVSDSTAYSVGGVQMKNPIAKNTYGECAAAVKSGAAEFVYTDYALLLGYVHQDPADFKVIDTGESIQHYAIGLPFGDDALTNAINAILGAAISNGTWRAIFNATLGPEGFTANPPTVADWS